VTKYNHLFLTSEPIFQQDMNKNAFILGEMCIF